MMITIDKDAIYNKNDDNNNNKDKDNGDNKFLLLDEDIVTCMAIKSCANRLTLF